MSRRRIPLCATAGALLAIYQAYQVAKVSPTGGARWKSFVANITGYDVTTKTFNPLNMGITLPLAVGVGVSYAASKAKVNKYLPRPLAF